MIERPEKYFALRLLKWFCPEHLYEEIEGDLIYKFNKDVKAIDIRKAKSRLLWNTIGFFRLGIILRNKPSIHLIQFIMWKNYLTTTIRMLGRNKSYSFINIFGLAVGIASAILIMLWVEDEYTGNHFFPNHRNIYQVLKNSTFNSEINTDDEMCIPVYQTLKSTSASIKGTCYTGRTYGHTIDYKNKLFNKEGLAVSEEFLAMFELPW